MSMHGLDVTCLPDLLIFVLSLKINCALPEKLTWEELYAGLQKNVHEIH